MNKFTGMNINDDRIIELKELRIGNILEYKGELVIVTMLSMDIDDEYQETICFVQLGTSSQEMGGWNRSLVNDLKRVPLTPQWLERCGFEPVENALALTLNEPYQEICYLFKKMPLCLGIDTCRMPLHLKYLHQFQNLYFALTGEELTIKELV